MAGTIISRLKAPRPGHPRFMKMVLAVLCSIVTGVSLVGCSGGNPNTPPPSSSGSSAAAASTAPGFTPMHAPAAEPGRAAPPSVAPVGKIVPIGNAPEGIVIGTSGVGAVAVRGPDGIELFDASTGAVHQTLPTAGAARHLEMAGSDGPVPVPLEQTNELSELSLADG